MKREFVAQFCVDGGEDIDEANANAIDALADQALSVVTENKNADLSSRVTFTIAVERAEPLVPASSIEVPS